MTDRKKQWPRSYRSDGRRCWNAPFLGPLQWLLAREELYLVLSSLATQFPDVVQVVWNRLLIFWRAFLHECGTRPRPAAPPDLCLLALLSSLRLLCRSGRNHQRSGSSDTFLDRKGFTLEAFRLVFNPRLSSNGTEIHCVFPSTNLDIFTCWSALGCSYLDNVLTPNFYCNMIIL